MCVCAFHHRHFSPSPSRKRGSTVCIRVCVCACVCATNPRTQRKTHCHDARKRNRKRPVLRAKECAVSDDDEKKKEEEEEERRDEHRWDFMCAVYNSPSLYTHKHKRETGGVPMMDGKDDGRLVSHTRPPLPALSAHTRLFSPSPLPFLLPSLPHCPVALRTPEEG